MESFFSTKIVSGVWKIMFKLIIAFPTSYLVETGFSVVNSIHTKKRNAFNVAERGDLRLALTEIEPDIMTLAKNQQAQGSH